MRFWSCRPPLVLTVQTTLKVTTLKVTVAKLSHCYISAGCQSDLLGGFCRVDFRNITIQITFPRVPTAMWLWLCALNLIEFRTFIGVVPCGTTDVIRNFLDGNWFCIWDIQIMVVFFRRGWACIGGAWRDPDGELL